MALTVNGTFIAWTLGSLTILGTSGFATAGDFRMMEKIQKQTLVATLDQSIFESRRSNCLAVDPSSKYLYAQRMWTALSQYRNLQGYSPRIPDCGEFGLAATVGNGP